MSIPLQIVDSHDGVYRVEFKATVVSTYIMNVTVASQQIPASPYRVQVQPIHHITDSYDMLVARTSIDNNFHAVDCSSSSSGQCSASLFSESGNEVDVEPAASGKDVAVSSASSRIIERSSSLSKTSDSKPAVGMSSTTVIIIIIFLYPW